MRTLSDCNSCDANIVGSPAGYPALGNLAVTRLCSRLHFSVTPEAHAANMILRACALSQCMAMNDLHLL